jgi:hypothetical protein
MTKSKTSGERTVKNNRILATKTIDIAAIKDIVLCDGRYVMNADVEGEVWMTAPDRNADNDVDFFGDREVVFVRLMSATSCNEDGEDEQPIPSYLLTPMIVSDILTEAHKVFDSFDFTKEIAL